MGEVIDFLLIAIFLYYIIRAVLRVVMPMVFQNVVNKAQEQQQYRQQNFNQNYNNTNATQGKIKVDHIPVPKKGSIPDSEGDFIDYEEIK
jgi:hypothetical protein